MRYHGLAVWSSSRTFSNMSTSSLRSATAFSFSLWGNTSKTSEAWNDRMWHLRWQINKCLSQNGYWLKHLFISFTSWKRAEHRARNFDRKRTLTVYESSKFISYSFYVCICIYVCVFGIIFNFTVFSIFFSFSYVAFFSFYIYFVLGNEDVLTFMCVDS